MFFDSKISIPYQSGGILLTIDEPALIYHHHLIDWRKKPSESYPDFSAVFAHGYVARSFWNEGGLMATIGQNKSENFFKASSKKSGER
jgi:hypothetical protein